MTQLLCHTLFYLFISYFIITSFSPSAPVHSQPGFGHRMINDRIFISVALSGKTSYQE